MNCVYIRCLVSFDVLFCFIFSVSLIHLFPLFFYFFISSLFLFLFRSLSQFLVCRLFCLISLFLLFIFLFVIILSLFLFNRLSFVLLFILPCLLVYLLACFFFPRYMEFVEFMESLLSASLSVCFLSYIYILVTSS